MCRVLHKSGAASVFIALFLIAPAASGKPTPTDPISALREAEAAFQSVDFAATLALAQGGLELGVASPAQTARLHVLAGTSAATLGNDEESRKHFLVALAIQPNLKLEQDLSPKIRDPYLEALGSWGSQAERLTLKVRFETRSGRLVFQLADPAELSRSVRVYTRIHGHDSFEVHSIKSGPRGRFDLSRETLSSGFDYYATLVDEHGNHLVEVGTEDEWFSVDPQRSLSLDANLQIHQPPKEPVGGRSIWLPVAFVGSGLVVGGLGAYFNIRREQLAARWNGKTCEQPGLTRIQQCSSVNTERTNMERLAVGSYALGGVLLGTGVTLLLLGTNSRKDSLPPQSQVSCSFDALGLSLGCDGRF